MSDVINLVSDSEDENSNSAYNEDEDDEVPYNDNDNTYDSSIYGVSNSFSSSVAQFSTKHLFTANENEDESNYDYESYECEQEQKIFWVKKSSICFHICK